MAGMLAEEDPALAWRHARAARSKGGRIAVVRETVGLVAYHAGEWADAISELRAARRMTGGPGQLPVMADCERALGHPEKAIELSRSAEAADLDPSSAAELRIVVAGARADLGQLDAAIAHLEGALQPENIQPFTARLFYAYADLLLQAERRAEAVDWFMKAAEIDVDEETDAGERLTELAGGGDDVEANELEDVTVDENVDARLDLDLDEDYDIAGSTVDLGSDREIGSEPADLSGWSADLDGGDGERIERARIDDANEGDETAVEATDVDDDAAGDHDGTDTVLDDGAADRADDDDAIGDGDGGDRAETAADVDVADVDTADVDVADVDADDDTTAGDDDGGDRYAANDMDAEDDTDDAPGRPASAPRSMGSLFSHNEGGL